MVDDDENCRIHWEEVESSLYARFHAKVDHKDRGGGGGSEE